MYDQYVALDYDPDLVTELGGNVYQEHKDEYEQAHGIRLEKVDHITYPLYIQNQTAKRYLQIVKKDAVSGKLVPLNDFYFKVWDCTRNRWVEDNRNSTVLGNIDIWQTNAQGQATGVNGEDLAGKANLVDFLEFSENGYDIYEVHPHAGYYLSETPVHFDFNYDTYKPEEPVVVEFFNKPVLGNATLYKTGQGATNFIENEDGTTSLEFTDVDIKGAIFGVYVADEQPIRARDVDKTVRENRNTKRNYTYTVDTEYPETARTISFTASDILNAGALVETIITDENGIIKTSNLYEGKYYFKELYSPVGYELDESKIPFEIRDTHNQKMNLGDTNLNPHSPTATTPAPDITAPNLNYQPEKERLGAVVPTQAPTLEPLEMVFVDAYNKRQHVEINLLKRFVLPVDGKTLDWTGTKVQVFAGMDIPNPNYVPPAPKPEPPVDSKEIALESVDEESSHADEPDAGDPPEEEPPPEPEFLYVKDQLVQEFEVTPANGSLLTTKELPFGNYYAKVTQLPGMVICRTETFPFPVFLPEPEQPEQPENPDEPQEPKPTTGTFAIDLTRYFVWAWDAEHEMEHLAQTPSEMFQDVTFGLYNRKEIKNAVTGAGLVPADTLLCIFSFDENGNGTSKMLDEKGNVIGYSCDLPIGDYYVKELTTCEGYILNVEEYDLRFYPNEIAQKKLSVIAVGTNKDTLLNRPDGTPELPEYPQPEPPKPEKPDKPHKPKPDPPKKGYLVLTKTDVTATTPLPNCGIQVLDENMKLVFQSYTNEKGKVTFTLSPGKYFYRECQAPEGYQLDDTPVPFEILSSGNTVTATMTNVPANGKLELTKKDVSDGILIPDCGVEILDESGKIIRQGRTDENGVIVFEQLPAGNYFYREFDALKGYRLDNTPFPFSIRENGEIVKAEMTNEKLPSYLELTKKDVSDGTLIPDCGVEILDESGKVILQDRTDSDGVVKFQLPTGSYFYREFDAPYGYVLDTTPFPFEIRENGEIVKAVMTNEAKIGRITATYQASGGGTGLTGTPKNPGYPKTGDNLSVTYLAIAGLSVSGMGLLVLLLLKKRWK